MPKFYGSLRCGIFPREHGPVFITHFNPETHEVKTVAEIEAERRADEKLASMTPAEKKALIAQLEAS